MSIPTASDETRVRHRPDGWPVMHQTWKQLIFLHWPVAVEQLRPHIPAGLEIDTWEGTGWVGLTPLTIRGIRPPLSPPLPMLSQSHELNFRTYVQRDGIPGVWFFSLDASNALAVLGARVGYGLPYFRAQIRMSRLGERLQFACRRTHRRAPAASFSARWRRGSKLPEAMPGTAEYFWIERYCLYSRRQSGLYRARIYHQPWPLCAAELEQWETTLFSAHGLADPVAEPIVHAQASPLHVRVWPPKRIA